MNNYTVKGLDGFGPYDLTGPHELPSYTDTDQSKKAPSCTHVKLFRLAPVEIATDAIAANIHAICQGLRSRREEILKKLEQACHVDFGMDAPGLAIWVAQDMDNRFSAGLLAEIRNEVLLQLGTDYMTPALSINVGLANLLYKKPIRQYFAHQKLNRFELPDEHGVGALVELPPKFSISIPLYRDYLSR